MSDLKSDGDIELGELAFDQADVRRVEEYMDGLPGPKSYDRKLEANHWNAILLEKLKNLPVLYTLRDPFMERGEESVASKFKIYLVPDYRNGEGQLENK